MGAAGSSPVTMADVARHAGVSTATVSRALSGTRPMDPALQARVLAAADALGYRINLIGRALRRRRTSIVGLVVPDLDNPFFATLAHHLGRAFAPSGTDLLTFNADSSLPAELRGVQSFVDRQVDALIVVPVHETASQPSIELAARSVLTVQLDRRVPRTGGHFVGCSNRRGMRLIADHVAADVDITSQPVAYVGAEPTSSAAHERLDAFRATFGTDAASYLGSFDASWGQEAADRLLGDGWRSGTIITAADIIAIGVLSRLQSCGMRIPDEFRVIGFDGIGVTRLVHPTLTTVRQPFEKMSQAIHDLIEARLEDPGSDPPRSVRLTPTLVIGESSPARPGPPRGKRSMRTDAGSRRTRVAGPG